MLLDSRSQLAISALLTGGTGTWRLADTVDLGGMDSLSGLWFVVDVAETATSGGAATAQFSLVSATNSDLTTGIQYHTATGAIPLASIVAGRRLTAFELRGRCSRYLGVLLTVGTSAFTAGRVSIFITDDVSAWKAHAAARTF